MQVTLLDTLYVRGSDGKFYTIRQSTRGVENSKSRAFVFYDVTRTFAVAFDRETCIQDHTLFSCRQDLSDQEVKIRDVFSVLQKNNVSLSTDVIEQLKSL